MLLAGVEFEPATPHSNVLPLFFLFMNRFLFAFTVVFRYSVNNLKKIP